MTGHIERTSHDGIRRSRWVEDPAPDDILRPNPSVSSGGPGSSWPMWLFLGAFFAAFAPVGLAIGLLAGAWEPLLGDLIAVAVFVPFFAWLEHVG